MAHNVIAMFPDLGRAEAAVGDLLQSGVKREWISVVSHDATERYRDLSTWTDDQRRQKALQGLGGGALLGATTGALIALGVAFVPGLWIIGAGPLASILGGAGIGAGVGAAAGGIGGALDRIGIPEGPAQRYAEALRRGGTMIAVEVPDDQAKHVATVLERHHPIDMDRSARRWEEAGWTGYDRKARPYPPREAELERQKWASEARHGAGGRVRSYDPDATSPPVVDEGAAVGAPPAVPGGGRVRSYPLESPTTEHDD